jgi:LEA14-like dessication related protein
MAKICENFCVVPIISGNNAYHAQMFISKNKNILAGVFLTIFMAACHKPQGLDFTGFRQFNVQPLSFSTSRISCEVGVYNPNNFSIKVKHLETSIMLADKALGEYRIEDTTILLEPKQPFYLPIQLEVSNGALLSNMLSVMSGDSIPYTLAGKVRAGRKIATAEIPFSYSGRLSQKDFQLGF